MPLSPQRKRLGIRLRELRATTGLSGNRFATERIKWAQSKVSRLETGKQIPTDDELGVWVEAAGATAEQVEGLRDLLAAARIEYATWHDIASRAGEGGLPGRQAEYAAEELEATRFAEYQPGMIPGILQTAAYAREVLRLPGGPLSAGASVADVEALIGQRVRRQAILYQPGRLIQAVIGEAALYAKPGSQETMVDQLHRLIDFAGLGSVEVAVLPTTALPVMPLTSFAIRNEDCVLVETLTGEYRLSEANEVAVYEQVFDLLRSASAVKTEAVALIRRAVQAASG